MSSYIYSVISQLPLTVPLSSAYLIAQTGKQPQDRGIRQLGKGGTASQWHVLLHTLNLVLFTRKGHPLQQAMQYQYFENSFVFLKLQKQL